MYVNRRHSTHCRARSQSYYFMREFVETLVRERETASTGSSKAAAAAASSGADASRARSLAGAAHACFSLCSLRVAQAKQSAARHVQLITRLRLRFACMSIRTPRSIQ